ncbi:MAG: hypothetical protein U9O56_02730 [Campylobacterota bacterium]|nr:hypothetical protein [Campylobacterota bacterium]
MKFMIILIIAIAFFFSYQNKENDDMSVQFKKRLLTTNIDIDDIK